MICHRANAKRDTAIEANADEPTAIYLRHTPIGITLGCIGAVLIVIFVVTSALLACVVYPIIWLSIKTGRSVIGRFWTPQERRPWRTPAH
jgi:hypothetical protein